MIDMTTIRPHANLYEANLQGANLQGADLCGADMRYANLHGASLQGADLCGANLYGANLHGANLYEANLRGANLRDADLHGAILHEARISGATHVPALAAAQTSICPAGDIVGWKKAHCGDVPVIVELLIPADAQRSNATGRKCRASKAVVVSISHGAESAASSRDPSFVYRVGETVEPREPFCEDRWNECASGIHFFITREEAEDY